MRALTAEEYAALLHVASGHARARVGGRWMALSMTETAWRNLRIHERFLGVRE